MGLTEVIALAVFSISIKASKPSNSCSWQTSLNVAPARQFQHIDPVSHAFEFAFFADVSDYGFRPGGLSISTQASEPLIIFLRRWD